MSSEIVTKQPHQIMVDEIMSNALGYLEADGRHLDFQAQFGAGDTLHEQVMPLFAAALATSAYAELTPVSTRIEEHPAIVEGKLKLEGAVRRVDIVARLSGRFIVRESLLIRSEAGELEDASHSYYSPGTFMYRLRHGKVNISSADQA